LHGRRDFLHHWSFLSKSACAGWVIAAPGKGQAERPECVRIRAMNDYEAALQGWMSRSKVADEDADDLTRARPDADHLTALERVKEWVRRRFSLAPDAAILVSEVACNLPGCPPLETAVAFWTKNENSDTRHHFKM